MRTGQEAWEQKQEDAYDPQQESDLLLEQDYDEDIQKACLDAYDPQKESDLQKEAEYDIQKESELQKEAEYDVQKDNEEIQGGADQLGNVWHADCQLQPELPSTVPVPHPVRRHNPPGTGAGAIRRAKVAFAVAAGTTNPSKEGLKHAEKQLRQCQREGKSKAICFLAKNKVRDYHQKVLLWDHHRQTNIEGTEFLTEFARQRIGAAADEYATSKFSENIRNFDAAERAQRE